MQRVNEFVFYDLALQVHSLTELDYSQKYSLVWFHWWQAREALNEIYRQRALNFTTPVATRLYRAISNVVPEGWEKAIQKLPPQNSQESDILAWQISEIKEAATEFETVLRTECQLMDTYFVSKKGISSTKDLVENAHHQVPEPCRSRLPDQTKLDFDQAGKCIAFDVPTAGAFHLLRGTEAVIRQYYDIVVPGPRKAHSKMRNWGAYIRLLKGHDADQNVISLLNHLKDVYRNPVLHPEENYSDESVQVLMGVCISAVVLMENAIHKLNSQSAPLPFTNALAALSGRTS